MNRRSRWQLDGDLTGHAGGIGPNSDARKWAIADELPSRHDGSAQTHTEQRRLFTIIEQVDPGDNMSLGAIWRRLATFLEVHAETEERLFYPELLRIGRAAGDKDSVEDETLDAIKDHNEIRDAVAAVGREKIGTLEWFKAVAAANKANSDHMAEEEREGLTDFRRHAPLQLRHDLAVAFIAYEAEHVSGVLPVDKDPKLWVAEH